MIKRRIAFDIFVDRVFRLYGIRILVDWAPGVQKRIILSYSEEISVQDIAVRVGLCVCTIESAPTEVPDSWRIPFRMFEKAHPLVIDVLSLSSEGDAERRFGVMFSNVADFQEKRPKGEYATRYKFNAAGCLEPVVEDEPIRGDFVREVSISWPRIVSEVASDV